MRRVGLARTARTSGLRSLSLLPSLRRTQRRVLATLTAALFPTAVSAITVSGTIPNLDPPFDSLSVTVDVDFAFDPGCSLDCQLHITLTNSTASQLQTIGQTLTGITFEPDSAITIDRSQSTVHVDTLLGDMLVGSGSVTATSELISGTNIDITRHWGFDLLAEPVPAAGGTRMLGSYVVSSVGDVANGTPVLGNVGLIGRNDLFTGSGIISSIERNPPNGTEFSIVNDLTCAAGTCGGLTEGFQDNKPKTWVQNSLTIWLHYDGQLTSVSKVEPIFGTDGNATFVVPEPGIGLLVLGLAALALARPRPR
jgi:hypothetical protein